MQPYFFPYLGYFSLIKATDKWIVFDISQYEKYSWMNRNRILKLCNGNWMYINVPINKHPLNTAMNRIHIHNQQEWESKIIAQMGYYQKHAPYYSNVIGFLNEVLKPKFLNLSKLNIHTLKATCAYIGLNFNYEVYSKMDINIEAVNSADEWGLNICKAMGVTNFINPQGGQQFMDREKYSNNDIKLRFLEFGNTPYNQKNESFIAGLSIIDAMMFNSPSDIYQMLDNYQLVE